MGMLPRLLMIRLQRSDNFLTDQILLTIKGFVPLTMMRMPWLPMTLPSIITIRMLHISVTVYLMLNTDAPPVASVAHKPDELMDDTNNDHDANQNNHDATADFNKKSVAVNHQALMDSDNIISLASQKQKQTNTSTGVDPPDNFSGSSSGAHPLTLLLKIHITSSLSSCNDRFHCSKFQLWLPLSTNSWQTVQVFLSWHVNCGPYQ